MAGRYEFWLTDDMGRRLALLSKVTFCSYSRTIQGFGTIQLGIPYDFYIQKVSKTFQPDWRIDVWRSAGPDYTFRREGSFFIRKYSVYQRVTDNMRMVEFIGRSPWDILRRASVITDSAAYYSKTDYIDDMMKAIVTDNFITAAPGIVPAGEFTVQADASQGPSVTYSFYGRVVLDILKELKEASFTLHRDNSTNRRIFFDVVEVAQTLGFGYQFRTYADQRGTDRTTGAIFSPENGNFEGATYFENYLDQATDAWVWNQTNGIGVEVTSREARLSRWNKIHMFQSGTGGSAPEMQTKANQVLADAASQVALSGTFVDSAGGKGRPRSLYGVDWDMGDLLPVSFAGKNLTCEVVVVYVAVDEEGRENIEGKTEVGM